MNRSNEASTERSEQIRKVEGLSLPISINPDRPPLKLDLLNLMELYRVPGISVAVIDHFEIAWAKGYGVTERDTSTPVTPHTLFESGSLSKPVAAVGALALIQQGKMLLDEDVNRKLKSWQVPENDFTWDQKVTLRRILSHTAGLTVHGFPGYDIDETVPTVVQILNGEPPTNTAPVRVEIVPGTKWSYSGGGTVIAQQLMEDVSGRPFPQLMRQIVFNRLGMGDSTYEQPLPREKHAMAASGTLWNGTTVHGKWHIYPEMAAAGLWSTPSELAKLLIEIALSQNGSANHILSQSMAQAMLSPQTESLTQFLFGRKENPARMGLGFFLGDQTHPNLFGHTGDDAGFQAMMVMDSITGQGAVIMTNSELGGLLADTLVDSIAQEYHWQDYVQAERPRAIASAILLTTARSQGIQAALAQYQTLKEAKRSQLTLDQDTLLILGYLFLADEKLENAVEALKLEVLEYPQYWNAYDTLAEIYVSLGEGQLAIQNYEKSLDINPHNQNAAEHLKNLRE